MDRSAIDYVPFFQKICDSVRFILNKNGFKGLLNYMDVAFRLLYKNFINSLLQELGFGISHKKLCPPSIQVMCLCILFDTKTRTVYIPEDKMTDVIHMCTAWSDKRVVSKNELQSLLGLPNVSNSLVSF